MIAYTTGRVAVLDTIQAIFEFGAETSPRGQKTKEVLGCQFLIQEPWDVIPDGIGRANLKPAIGAIEALQNISGRSRPELFHQIVPASKRWGDDVATYGERLHAAGQLQQVVARLKEDPDTRQAVALIWGREDLTNGQASNLCTIGLQFLVRDDSLVGFAYMRSNDAWYGLCYDLFQFTQLQITIANSLGIRPGPYVHHATSMHLYERHWEAAAACADEGVMSGVSVSGVGYQGMDWLEITARAEDILFGREPDEPTPSELWYLETLRPYEEAAQAAAEEGPVE